MKPIEQRLFRRFSPRKPRISAFTTFILLIPYLIPPAFCGISYNAVSRTVKILDYPRIVPCRPLNILQADRMNGWNIIDYDEQTNTYLLRATLRIGDNNHTNTYFQVGGKDNLKEKLAVQGNVIIYPEYVKGENESKGRDWINSLTIGMVDNKECQATLRVLNGEKTKHSIYISRIPAPDGGYLHKPYTAFGGDFNVYNSTVGGIDTNSKMGQPLLYGKKIVLDHAIIENFEGCFTSGCFPPQTDIADTLFRHGDSAMRNPGFDTAGCKFEHLKTAIAEAGGPLKATLTQCAFSDNFRNFLLRYRGGYLILIDCDISQAKTPDVYGAEAKGNLKRPPAIIIFQHNQRFQINDTENKAISNAVIEISSERTASSIHFRTSNKVSTNQTGDASANLTTQTITQEKKANYTYKIQIHANGYEPKTIKGFSPLKQMDTLIINLRKNEQDRE